MKSGILTRLGDVMDITSGFAFDSDSFSENKEGVALVRIRDVDRGFSSTFYGGAYEDKYVIQDGDLLVSMDGEFRVRPWQGGRALLNQRVCRLEPRPGLLEGAYLKYLVAPELKRIEDKTPFVTVKHLSTKALLDLRVPLPPLSEQKRIADILDKADAVRRKRWETIDLSKRLTESAFSNLFGDTWSNDRKWPAGSLENLCDEIVDCPHSTPEYSTSPTGYHCVRSSDIQDGKIDLAATREVSKEVYEERIMRHKPQAGEVVFTREGGRLGNAAQIPPDHSLCLGQRMMLFSAKPKASTNEFIWALLNSPGVQRQMRYLIAGAAAPRINIADILRFKAILPPFDLQHRFTNIVVRVRDQEALARKASLECNGLFNGLVQRAFRGQL
jgi:type I restriction enzyme, S subunit